MAGSGERQRHITTGNTAEEFHALTHFTAPEALNYISEQLLSPWDFLISTHYLTATFIHPL